MHDPPPVRCLINSRALAGGSPGWITGTLGSSWVSCDQSDAVVHLVPSPGRTTEAFRWGVTRSAFAAVE